MGPSPARGSHALHFHADDLHFGVTAGEFLRQASRSGARAAYLAPPRLARMVEAAAAGLPAGRDAGWLRPLPQAGDPEAVAGAAADALRKAIASGHAGLWIVRACDGTAPEERPWTALCEENPGLVVLCSCPFAGAGSPARGIQGGAARLMGLLRCHTHYYLEGKLLELAVLLSEH